jgi:hypothetical protein
MKGIRGFTRSHWMPSSDKCPRRIAPAAAMVIIIGMSKNHKTQLGFTLQTLYSAHPCDKIC